MVRRRLIAATLSLPVLAALGIRAVEVDAETYHVDPGAGGSTGRPNEFRVAPGGDMEAVHLPRSAEAVATQLDAIALGEPRTAAIAGSPEDGFTTYVQRSRLMGWPDIVSVRVEPDGDGARVLIWSRARYGHSDLGVNRARVERWLDKLGAPLDG